MEDTRKKMLDKKLVLNQSIAKWAIGFYVCTGGEHGFNLKIPIFGIMIIPQSGVAKVLVDYLNEMFWINVNLYDIFRDEQRVHLCSEIGITLRKQLEGIKSYSLN